MTLPSSTLLPGPSFPAASSRDLTLVGRLEPARFTGSLETGRRITGRIGDDVTRLIPISVGAVEYVTVDLTDSAGADLTGAVVQMTLGSYTAPGAWLDPDILTFPSAGSARASLLVGEQYTPTAGEYWVWARVADSPEVMPVRCSTSSITIS